MLTVALQLLRDPSYFLFSVVHVRSICLAQPPVVVCREIGERLLIILDEGVRLRMQETFGICESAQRRETTTLRTQREEIGSMMTRNGEEVAAHTSGGGGGRVIRKSATKFSENDKENFNICGAGGHVGLNETKSPLPVGYPRLPLQDITTFLQPLKNMSDEEEPSIGWRKPFTRSRSFRKSADVHVTVSSERTCKNASRAGGNKTRRKRAMKIAVDDKINMQIAVDEKTKSISQADDEVQQKQDTVHLMIMLSSSDNLVKQTMEMQQVDAVQSAAEETPVKVAVTVPASDTAGSIAKMDKENVVKKMEFSEAILTEEEGRAALEKPKESRPASSSGTRNQYSQDQKRRKPLSTRSRISSFR